MNPRVEELGAALLAAHRVGRASAAGGKGLASVEDAYRVQEHVLAGLAARARPAAWKVSPPRPGSEPLASPVPTSILPSPAAIACGDRSLLGFEAEIAFRFATAPTAAMDAAALRSSVSHAVVLIELCATRFERWSEACALEKLADFQSHGAFVVGSGTVHAPVEFAAQAVEVMVDGREVARAVGSHPTLDLWSMVAWAVGHCAARGMPLAAGDVVTTGSWTGITPLAPGGEARVRFPGIGEARLRLAR